MNRTQEYRSLTSHNQLKPYIPAHEIPPHTWQSLHKRIAHLHNDPNTKELQIVKAELHSLNKRVATLRTDSKFYGGVKRTLEIFVIEMMIEVNALLKKYGDGIGKEDKNDKRVNKNDKRVDKNDRWANGSINADSNKSANRTYDVLLHETESKSTQSLSMHQLHKMHESTSTTKRQNYTMLNTQITEIGQLMTDISMHINIQGENLKRIDEVIERVDDNLFGSFREIERVWDSVKGRRRTIMWFVALWIVVVLLYVLFRSI